MKTLEHEKNPRYATMEQVLERFWSKVKKTKTCWLWIGAIDTDGYGNWCYRKKMVKPHRFSYEIHK